MPPALEMDVKNRVWRLWLSGETRKNIAEVCGIGAGSVTIIINEKTKDFHNLEYGAIRDLAVQLKKERLTFAELASICRCHNYINKLGANDEEVESLIADLLDKTKSIPIEKTANLVNQLYELSKSESVPATEVPAYINQKIKDKQKLEEEIQKLRAILDQKNVDIQTIEEYKKLEDELKTRHLSMEAPSKLVTVLDTIEEMGNDSQKIVTSLARIKSFRQTERRLKKNCRFWESRAAHYKEAFRMCERVVSNGIGISLVLALETAVIKKIEVDGVPASSAPYRIMQDIEDYNRLGGIKKQVSDMMMQIHLMKEFLGRQNDAIHTFMKLRLSGMAEDQILKTCRVIERDGRSFNPHYTLSNVAQFG